MAGDENRLGAGTIAAVDSTGQLAEVLGLAEHLRDALWRVDSAGARALDAPGGVLVAGMGGSAAGARLAIAALGGRLRRPLAVADGYRLPGWAGPGTLVLCSSYSGATEETLSAYDDALERGAPRLVATTGGPLGERARRDGVPVIPLPGGFQPRAAIGYALVSALERGAPRLVATTGGPLGERARRDGVPVIPLPGGFQPRAAIGYALVSALEAVALAGAAPSLRDEIEAAAALAERLAAEWGPDGADDGEAKTLARALHRTVPVIAGAELAAAAAYRWKCQFNENASLPAFASVLPEADHNEVVGWAAARELGRFSYVSLEDPSAHPRNRLRADLTAGIAAAGADPVLRVSARGESPVERLVSLVLLGDLVTIYTAVLRGSDPVDIPAIDGLKAALSER